MPGGFTEEHPKLFFGRTMELVILGAILASHSLGGPRAWECRKALDGVLARSGPRPWKAGPYCHRPFPFKPGGSSHMHRGTAGWSQSQGVHCNWGDTGGTVHGAVEHRGALLSWAPQSQVPPHLSLSQPDLSLVSSTWITCSWLRAAQGQRGCEAPYKMCILCECTLDHHTPYCLGEMAL